MSKQNKLSLDLLNESNISDLSIELLIDNQSFYNNKVTPGRQSLEHEFNLDDGEHTFSIVLSGKTVDHTKIDEEGTIVDDVLIKINNVKFNNIAIDQLMYEQSTYVHDVNASAELTNHKFYGPMGCNGTVTFKFTTPFYIWLLENM